MSRIIIPIGIDVDAVKAVFGCKDEALYSQLMKSYLFKKFYRVPTGNVHQVNLDVAVGVDISPVLESLADPRFVPPGVRDLHIALACEVEPNPRVQEGLAAVLHLVVTELGPIERVDSLQPETGALLRIEVHLAK